MERNIDNPVGLCATCAHVEIVRSDRGSVFYLCKLSASDPRFPKYPRLPVLSCIGYEKTVSERTRRSTAEPESGRE
ncbi:MAG: hypothetical protein ABSF54_27435 [Bryobacteraceae bacterium]